MKNYFIIALPILFLISIVAFMPQSFAQTNTNLYVSAENSDFDNHFAGPMVIEVIVDDPTISSLTGVVVEPEVTINDQTLRMVQATNGKWYAYFADKTQAQNADELVGLAGHGLDFGELCGNNSFVSELNLSTSAGFAIPRDIATGSNGQESLGACTTELTSSDTFINNVVRNPPLLNTQSSFPGQIGISQHAWPLIQFFDLDPSSTVNVKYNSNSGTQLVALTFDNSDGNIETTLFQGNYRIGNNVKVNVTDPMLNIDPTDADSWTWATTSGSEATYYQLFNKDGAKQADGTNGAVDIQNSLSSLMFENNGILKLNPNTQSATNNVIILQDNADTILEDKYTSDASIDLATDTISHTKYPVTFTEINGNSGIFGNYDESDVANMVINEGISSGKSATFDYNKKPKSIVVKTGSPPFANSHSVNTLKDTPVLITVIASPTDADGDTLYVSLTDISDVDGAVTVNSNNTITFNPDSGFLGTTSFTYTVDDILDGTDTDTVTISVNLPLIAASINQISVYSDKSTYHLNDTMDVSWIIPNDSQGTDTKIRVTSPLGTTALSETISNGTGYLAPTTDYVDGTYTIRVEHGQYYGEKIVLFSLPEPDAPEETTPPVTTPPVTTPQTTVTAPATPTPVAPTPVTPPPVTTQTDDTSETKTSTSFGTPDKSPQHYIDRYNNEPSYKDWFDRNYSGLTIQDVVGYSDTSLSNFPDPTKPRLYYVERYNNEPSYRNWFDTSFPNDTFEEIIGVSPSMDSKSGTDLVCDADDVLIFKTKNTSPTCVRPHVAEKLIERGWATSFS